MSIIRFRFTPATKKQRTDGAQLRELYGLPCTGLRFFTVYGPWGRPDMALFSIHEGILAGRPIPVSTAAR